MKFIFNDSKLKYIRQELRASQTKVERILWRYLRRNQMCGIRFFRQYSIGPYIIDFYCPKLRLAVELDGSQHAEEEQRIYDKERTRYMRNCKIKVIRFWNEEVTNNTEGVVQVISKKVTNL